MYSAKTVFFAGEMGRLPGTRKWDTLAVERCSWGLAVPRSLPRDMLVGPMGMKEPHKHLEVLVVDRRDATNKARSISNHCDLMSKLNEKLPGANVREFVGSKVDLEDQVRHVHSRLWSLFNPYSISI